MQCKCGPHQVRDWFLLVFCFFVGISACVDAVSKTKSKYPLPAGLNFTSPANSSTLLALNLDGSDGGMFCRFKMVLGALDLCETGQFAGLKVAFKGLYYDPAVGSNWWEYFFYPIPIQPAKKLKMRVLSLREAGNFAHYVQCLSRQRGHALIQKYIRIKQPILDEIEHFTKKHFADSYIIGIHYRGTDKLIGEAKRVPYEKMKIAIREAINAILKEKKQKYRLFIATDEKPFLNYIRKNFFCPIIYTNAYRSLDDQPVHKIEQSGYQKGKEALIDCLLLARCSFLIRTESNLSHTTEYFNPNLPTLLMK
jgi:hypothetical protein